MPRPAIYVVKSPSHWTLMMAPVRFEILEAMRSLAPCSVREIALAIDRPSDTLYPHLRHLLKIGVVLDAGERPGRTRPERVYDIAADDFRPDFGRRHPASTASAIDRSMQTMGGIVARTSRAASRAGLLTYGTDAQNIVGKIEMSWLTPAEFRFVRDRLRVIKRFLDARKTRRDGSLHLAAFFVLPVARTRGAKVRSAVPHPKRQRARTV
ncbi:MAG: helix-turn-helix domain-containing protein [bacterium]